MIVIRACYTGTVETLTARRMMGDMTETAECVRCARDTRPGTRRFVGRRELPDGRYLCDECAHAGRGDVSGLGEVEITMPNTNFPNTH